MLQSFRKPQSEIDSRSEKYCSLQYLSMKRSVWKRAAWIIFVSLYCSGSPAIAVNQFGVDLNGRPINNLMSAGTHAVVLLFVASDCPIANRYIPEIKRLNRELGTASVRFWWVYPNPQDTMNVVRQHQKQFGIPGDAVLDIHQQLTHMARATITPEAAVFVPDGAGMREVYLGRIDDRYLALDKERPHALQHDLERAIQAALGHEQIPQPNGPPIGCSIVPR
ncbi:redoxin domain-containing protein [Paracidobacterium acidisoli]|uniref:Thioredoxin domain-containing protein n=1 Tax=Paracidobacterium acidisoli TaxID=2303751 RepID=A0A372ILS3_9BACT|nr:redoxin domain-containing protein [Paracidobacterium acidisoli]MBT9332527.1 redoxin domain-containing protein [Paracidobacterium acidisoli]